MRTLLIAAFTIILLAVLVTAQTATSKPATTTTSKPASVPAILTTSPSRPFVCLGYVPPAGMKVLRVEINIKDGKPIGEPVVDEITYDPQGINTKGLAALSLPSVNPGMAHGGNETDFYDATQTTRDGVKIEWHYARSQFTSYLEPFTATITRTPKEGKPTSWRITQSE
jgi:hypothetical protein